MPKLEFCQIDTKASGAYEPVEIWPADGEKGSNYSRADNMCNAKVMVHANAEYLNALLGLQKHIKEKFEPQLIENVKVEGEPEYLEEADGFEDLEKEYKALIKPGADNLYYT